MTQPVILFSGQGAQKIGMARDWIESSATARDLAHQADDALGYSITSIMFDGPEESLTATSRCQPALYLHGLIGLALLKTRPARRHGGHIRVLTGQFEELRHVFHDVLAGQQKFQLPLAVGVAAELLAKKWFHKSN
jgi:acyl transferase domain-containing protein